MQAIQPIHDEITCHALRKAHHQRHPYPASKESTASGSGRFTRRARHALTPSQAHSRNIKHTQCLSSNTLDVKLQSQRSENDCIIEKLLFGDTVAFTPTHSPPSCHMPNCCLTRAKCGMICMPCCHTYPLRGEVNVPLENPAPPKLCQTVIESSLRGIIRYEKT